MGGVGSGRPPKFENILKNVPQQPIGEEIFIPNYSGLKAGSRKTEEMTGVSPSLSGSAQVVGIIADTAATPPTASNYPLGTIYIQYTA